MNSTGQFGRLARLNGHIPDEASIEVRPRGGLQGLAPAHVFHLLVKAKKIRVPGVSADPGAAPARLQRGVLVRRLGHVSTGDLHVRVVDAVVQVQGRTVSFDAWTKVIQKRPRLAGA